LIENLNDINNEVHVVKVTFSLISRFINLFIQFIARKSSIIYNFNWLQI